MSGRTVRRHLQFIVSGHLADVVDEVRRRWDPVMANIAPPHITLTYPEEARDEALLLARAEEAVSRTAPFDVTFGDSGFEVLNRYALQATPRIYVVGDVLRQDQRMLLGFRSRDRSNCPSVWDLPEGRVEPDGTPAGAIAHELRWKGLEEVGALRLAHRGYVYLLREALSQPF